MRKAGLLVGGPATTDFVPFMKARSAVHAESKRFVVVTRGWVDWRVEHFFAAPVVTAPRVVT